MRNIEITGFHMSRNHIFASFDNDNDAVLIKKTSFENFLYDHGLLAIPVQVKGEEESCELIFGAMTLPEYYCFGNIKSDLYSFLVLDQQRIRNKP